MLRISLWRAGALAALCLSPLLAAAREVPVPSDPFTPSSTLRPFASEGALRAWFEPLVAERQRQQSRARAMLGLTADAVPAAAPAAAGAAESITNNQVAGVDEGGIVKVHGKHLVILRRGRLFTVAIDGAQLAPVASINAFGPDVSPQGAWYDEMLVSGDTVAVIGYSYARGGTELALFRIGADGQLAYRATHHLRSSDYYSSRNYASRLVGSQLVLYTPVAHDVLDPLSNLPAMRRWRAGATPPSFQAIAAPERIYRGTDTPDPQAAVILHSIIRCDLAQPELQCESTGVLGNWGRVFHVSGTAVYVWAMQGRQGASLFRLPLDGAPPSMLKVRGSPIDQFSFLEEADGMLNVLVRGEGRGDSMWAGESPAGTLSLLRVAVRDFGDGHAGATWSDYRALPPAAGSGPLQNRYVGRHLLYAPGTGWRQPAQQVSATLQVTEVRDGSTRGLVLPHGVDRIEALGRDAVAIGSDGRDLHFSAVRLASSGGPAVAHAWRRADAAQGETRSHGFFYKPESATEGLVGLPVRGGGSPGSRQLREGSAGMLYLHNAGLRLTEVGQIDARASSGRNDGCQASCVDWYGNARPIFLGGRVFALLGYELVEGKVLPPQQDAARRIVELRRVDFAPGSADYRR